MAGGKELRVWWGRGRRRTSRHKWIAERGRIERIIMLEKLREEGGDIVGSEEQGYRS